MPNSLEQLDPIRVLDVFVGENSGLLWACFDPLRGLHGDLKG